MLLLSRSRSSARDSHRVRHRPDNRDGREYFDITPADIRTDDGERDARNHSLFDDVECFDADRGSITHVYLWIDDGECSDVHNTRPRANERGAEHCLAFVGG